MIFSDKISFKYKKFTNEKGEICSYPIADIVLLNKDESFETAAFIDSGADISLIPKEIADVLGLEFGEESEAETLSGEKIKTWSSRVNMILVRGKNRISLNGVPIDIADSDCFKKENFNIILGRKFIFDNFKITFSQFEQTITFQKINLKWRPY